MNTWSVRASVGVMAVGFLAGTAAATIAIETVPVGDPGNAGELSGWGTSRLGPDHICGAVGYAYNIGKYEVTAGQYTEFLNAVAKTDTYGLFNVDMSNTSLGSGISRNGTSGSYTYSVDAAFVSRPVNYVSFWDACRFTNWLHNGQGNGDTETGAYTLTADGITNNTITRNANWKWAVTSEDEWYKAAYYKGGSADAGYFDYPTSSDTAPDQDMADASHNNANYYTAPFAFPIDRGMYTTIVGEFQNSGSPYGTFDQGGNVTEWTESLSYDPGRLLRGGSFYLHNLYLHASGPDGTDLPIVGQYGEPSDEVYGVGFRVVHLPEPATLVLLTISGPVSLRRRRA